jgi:hypothetical protein
MIAFPKHNLLFFKQSYFCYNIEVKCVNFFTKKITYKPFSKPEEQEKPCESWRLKKGQTNYVFHGFQAGSLGNFGDFRRFFKFSKRIFSNWSVFDVFLV